MCSPLDVPLREREEYSGVGIDCSILPRRRLMYAMQMRTVSPRRNLSFDPIVSMGKRKTDCR